MTEIGEIADSCVCKIPTHFPDVEVLNYTVMPNHLHLVLAIGVCFDNPDRERVGCLKPKMHDCQSSQSFHHNSKLAVVIGQLKSSVVRLSNARDVKFAWQPRFHEHIIRKPHDFKTIMDYVDLNVRNWRYDRFNENHSNLDDAPWRKNGNSR